MVEKINTKVKVETMVIEVGKIVEGSDGRWRVEKLRLTGENGKVESGWDGWKFLNV